MAKKDLKRFLMGAFVLAMLSITAMGTIGLFPMPDTLMSLILFTSLALNKEVRQLVKEYGLIEIKEVKE